MFKGFASDCDDFTSWTRIQFDGSIFGFIELTAETTKKENVSTNIKVDKQLFAMFSSEENIFRSKRENFSIYGIPRGL